MLRINGELHRVDYPPLESDTLKLMLYEIAPEYKIKVFEETGDVDFGYEIPGAPVSARASSIKRTALARYSARSPAACFRSRILKNLTPRCLRSSRSWPCCTRDWWL